MTGKHPGAVALGRLGGSVRSEAQTVARRQNATRPRPNRARWRALDQLHAAVGLEARYRLALSESSRRDSVTVRAFYWQHGRLPY